MKRTLLLATALLASASLRADPVTNLWIGGDQSASTAPNPFAEAANWSQDEAIAINYGNANTVLAVATAGDVAPWVSSASGYYINSPIVIGGAAGPAVTATFSSTRATPASGEPNDDPAAILLSQPFVLLGANTTVRLNRGLAIAFGHNNSGAECFSIDPGATLEGEGVLRFTGDLSGLPARDYDDLELAFGNSNDERTTALLGDAATGGRVIVTQSGSGGVNGLATLDLAGHTLQAGSLLLGLLDNRPEEGDQSGFGRVLLNGGTLDIAGNIVCRSNPDGVKTDGTPLSQDSSLSGGSAGGTVRLAGSMSGFATKTPSAWTVENVALVLCGDGTSVQDIEVMSGDFGDTETAAIGNYCWNSITVAAGASVRLVDFYDNHRGSSGSEAVYVGNLVVEPGATLNLNGLHVYCYGTATLDGTVTGGAPILTSNVGFIKVLTRSFGNAGFASSGIGYWIGGLSAGDLGKDGKTELVLHSTTERWNADYDMSIYAMRYANGVLTDVSPYPISDTTLHPTFNNTSANYLPVNFMVADPGLGDGERIVTTLNQVRSLDASGNLAVLSPSSETAVWDVDGMVLADLDGDGVCEAICGARSGNGNVGSNNLRVYDTQTATLKWSAAIPGTSGLCVFVGVADLDDDKKLEVFAVGAGTSADNNAGIYAFRANGDSYVSKGGTTIAGISFPGSVGGKSFGGIAAADITGDGVKDFVFTGSADNMIRAVSQEGAVIFSATSSIGQPDGFALLDVDKDGIYEILFANNLYKIANGSSSILATLPVPSGYSGVKNIPCPVLADFTGDQVPEAVYVLKNSSGHGRAVCVYDFAGTRILPGFPVELQMDIAEGTDGKNTAGNVTWEAGAYGHFNGSHMCVADLDGDGSFEIAVGTGWGNRYDNTVQRPTLNLIDTPWRPTRKNGRTMRDMGWYSYRHDAQGSFTFPVFKDLSTVILLR